MTDRPRVVLDTNVVVSAFLSRNPSSPTKELLERWRNGEFVLLVSGALVQEVVGKLLEKGIAADRVVEFAGALAALAEKIEVPEQAVRPLIPDDPDDDHVLACAVVGGADHLVTYDPHFDLLRGEYEGIRITRALPFLWALRGDRPPEGDLSAKGDPE